MIDILIAKEVKREEIIRAISVALGIEDSNIEVIHDFEDECFDGSKEYLAQLQRLEGDFVFVLSLYKELFSAVEHDIVNFCLAVSKHLNAFCATPDDSSVDPYQWIGVVDGTSFKFYMDSIAEEDEIYNLDTKYNPNWAGELRTQ